MQECCILWNITSAQKFVADSVFFIDRLKLNGFFTWSFAECLSWVCIVTLWKANKCSLCWTLLSVSSHKRKIFIVETFSFLFLPRNKKKENKMDAYWIVSSCRRVPRKPSTLVCFSHLLFFVVVLVVVVVDGTTKQYRGSLKEPLKKCRACILSRIEFPIWIVTNMNEVVSNDICAANHSLLRVNVNKATVKVDRFV